MGLLAIIKREPEITMSEWKRVVMATEALILPTPREIENPFRKGIRVVVKGPEGKALIVLDGAVAGAIEPARTFEADGVLDVYAGSETAEAVIRFTEKLAVTLNAKIDWLERSR